MSDESRSARLRVWLEGMQAGDAGARDQLLAHVGDQIQRHTQRMLRGYAELKRWVQTEDVFQNAMIRLLRALEEVKPVSVRHFLNLASLQIRRELVDLARHHFGPEGQGAHHASNIDRGSASAPPRYEQADDAREPARLAAWADFHEQAGKLPDEEREVFELLWYQELSQAEAAEILGVSERTVKRRWQAARLALHDRLQDQLPDLS